MRFKQFLMTALAASTLFVAAASAQTAEPAPAPEPKPTAAINVEAYLPKTMTAWKRSDTLALREVVQYCYKVANGAPNGFDNAEYITTSCRMVTAQGGLFADTIEALVISLTNVSKDGTPAQRKEVEAMAKKADQDLNDVLSIIVAELLTIDYAMRTEAMLQLQ